MILRKLSFSVQIKMNRAATEESLESPAAATSGIVEEMGCNYIWQFGRCLPRDGGRQGKLGMKEEERERERGDERARHQKQQLPKNEAIWALMPPSPWGVSGRRTEGEEGDIN